jgi:rhodanese-related sulfurtransferase
MADAPRITVEDLKRRMDAGEDFTVIDIRNPTAWAESDTMAAGSDPSDVRQARRKPSPYPREQTCCGVLH